VFHGPVVPDDPVDNPEMGSSTVISKKARAGVGLLVTGLTTTVMLSAVGPAPVWAADPVAAAASALVAAPTNLATPEDKVAAANALGINPGADMLVLNDQDFVLSLWRQAVDGSFVQGEALRAYDTSESTAAYDFITSGVFAAAAVDAQIEIAAAHAKALRRSVAVTVGIDPAVAEQLIVKNDRDFIYEVWKRVDENSLVWAAAKTALDGEQAEWTAFLTTGAQVAADQDMKDAIAKADAEKAAQLAAQQLVTAKQALLQLLLLPVTDELINAPNRQYVLNIKNTAKGTQVLLAAQAALNAADLEPALKEFIFTGGAAANKKDEDAAAAKELDGYKQRVTDIRNVAKADGVQPNLTAAADQALATGTALALQTFLLTGQDPARALDKTRNAQTVYTIAPQSGNFCLAVSAGSTTSGANALQWNCNGGAEQDWRLRARSDGKYEIRNDHSKMCLAFAAGSKENSAQAIQWPCNDATLDQTWLLTKAANGYTQLKNANSLKCLAIPAASKDNGEHAIQYTCAAGHAEQSWALKARTSGQRVVNKNSNLCLSNDAVQTNGAHIVQTVCNDANDAEWHVNALGDGKSEIRNDRTNLCLAIPAGSKENGAHAIQWTCGGASHLEQSWTVDTSTGEIKNVNSGQCLAIGSALKTDGAHALQWPCGGASHLEQVWKLVTNS
jgi:hypothetical protein